MVTKFNSTMLTNYTHLPKPIWSFQAHKQHLAKISVLPRNIVPRTLAWHLWVLFAMLASRPALGKIFTKPLVCQDQLTQIVAYLDIIWPVQKSFDYVYSIKP